MNKFFSNIVFDRKLHSYRLRGKSLTSVTELLSKLERETDWVEIAKTKAIKEGTSPDLLLKQWSDKRDQGAHKGSKVHRYIERRLRYRTEKDTELPEMIAFDNFWDNAKGALQPLMIEWVIGDYELGLGGTLDCLFYSNRTNKYHPFDWKTNQKFTVNNSFQNLKAPFDDLEDCHLIKYSLQLSAYKLILKRNTNLALGEGYIIHLGEDYKEYRSLDFSERLVNWVLTKT